jgi:SIR2-like domain
MPMANQAPVIGVLLGAGASADAGIPTTVAMTDQIIERIQDPEQRRLLEYVQHTLQADSASRNAPAVDVERLFASVELLIDRYEQPWSPFVSSWSRGLEAFSPAPSIRESDLSFELRRVDDALRNALPDPSRRRTTFPSSGSSILRDALGRLLVKAVQKARPSDVSQLLERARDRMLRSLFDLLTIKDSTRLSYLAPLAELTRQQGSLTVATLNYDQSIEELAKHERLECHTGIENWLVKGELVWPGRGIHLLKLHGSIDWVVRTVATYGQLPLREVQKRDGDGSSPASEPAVVFGQAGKLRSEGPYLELLLAWHALLKRVDALLIVGYSFRDDHVNEMIARWFNAEPTRRIIVVDPADPRAGGFGAPPSFGRSLGRVDTRRPGKPAPEVSRVEYVGGTARAALPRGILAASKGASTGNAEDV